MTYEEYKKKYNKKNKTEETENNQNSHVSYEDYKKYGYRADTAARESQYQRNVQATINEGSYISGQRRLYEERKRKAEEDAGKPHYTIDSLGDNKAYTKDDLQSEYDKLHETTGFQGAWNAITTDYTWKDFFNNNTKENLTRKNKLDTAISDIEAGEAYEKQKAEQEALARLTDDDLNNIIKASKEQGASKAELLPLEQELKRRDVASKEEYINNLDKETLELLDKYVDMIDSSKDSALAYKVSGDEMQRDLMLNAPDEAKKYADKLKAKGIDNYDELATVRRNMVNREITQDAVEEAVAFGSAHPVMGSVASAALSVPSNIGSFVGITQHDDYDTNSLWNAGTNIMEGLQAGVTSNFDDGVLSKDVKSFLYQTGMSGVDSVVASAIPGGSVLLGMGAFDQKFNEDIKNGKSRENAIAGAVASGTAELLFEEISIGQFKSALKSGKNGLANVIKETLWEAGVNFSEEANTEFANIMSDYLINGGLSDYEMNVQSYIDSGMSEEEARKQARIDAAMQIGEAGLGGALMGATMGGGAVAMNTGMQAVGDYTAGVAIADSNARIEEIITGGQATDSKRIQRYAKDISEAQQRVNNSQTQNVTEETSKVDESTSKVDESTSKVDENAQSEVENAQKSEKNAQKSEDNAQPKKEEKYSVIDKYKMGRVARAVEESYNADLDKAIKTNIKDRLSELGVNDSTVAEAVYKTANKDKLTKKEKASLENEAVKSKAEQVVKELNSLDSDLFAKNFNSATEINRKYTDRSYKADADEKVSIDTESAVNVENRADFAMGKAFEKLNNADYTLNQVKVAEQFYNNNVAKNGETLASDFARDYKQYYSAGMNSTKTADEFFNNETFDPVSNIDIETAKQIYKAGQAWKKAGETRIDNVDTKRDFKVNINDEGYVYIEKDGKGLTLEQAKENGVPLEDIEAYQKARGLKDRLLIEGAVVAYNATGTSHALNVSKLSRLGASGMSFADASKLDGISDLVKALGKENAQKIYNRGVTLADKAKREFKTVQKGKGGNYTENVSRDGKSKTETEKLDSLSTFYKALAAKTGINITLADEVEQKANGYFDYKTNSVVIAFNAQNQAAAIGHELVHAIKRYNMNGFKLIDSAIEDWLGESKMQEYIADRMAVYDTYEYDLAREEVIADALSGTLTTDTGLQEFVDFVQNDSGYSGSKIKQIIQAVKDALDRIVNALKDIINGKQELNKIALNAATMDLKTAEDLRQKFFEALESFDDNVRTEADLEVMELSAEELGFSLRDGEKRFSNKDSDGNTLSENQQKYFADSKVRDKDGNLLVMYHGTPNGTYTKFRSGTYFTENEEYAAVYKNPGASSISVKKTADNPMVYKVYLNITKPFDTRNADARKIFNDEFYRQWGTGTPLSDKGLPDWMDGEDLQEFLEEQGYDYDGIVLDEGATGGYGDEVKSRGISYKTFSSNQVKSVDNMNPTSDLDYRFSIQEPVEETKDLIAVHNLRETELLKTIKLGGFPAPSIAVIKSSQEHSKYGDITVIFGKNTIDPSLRNNYVYGGDGYTPVFPRVEYKINTKAAKKLSDMYYDLTKKYGYTKLDALYNLAVTPDYAANNSGLENEKEKLFNNNDLKEIFLREKGVNVPEIETIEKLKNPVPETAEEAEEYVRRTIFRDRYSSLINEFNKATKHLFGLEYGDALSEFVTSHKDEIESALLDSGYNAGRFDKRFKLNLLMSSLARWNPTETVTETDSTKRDAFVEKNADKEGYRSWVDNLTNSLIEKEGLRNAKDTYFSDGRRRSFEATHYEVTLENIVKAMFDNQDELGNGMLSKSLFGSTVKKYKNISEIKSDSSRLGSVSEEEYKNIRNNFTERFQKIMESFAGEQFERRMDAADDILDAITRYKTKSGLSNYLKKQKGFINYNENTFNDLIELINEIANMPTEYFEAKPQRAVGFDEVVSVVIPDNSSTKLINALESNNINYETYTADDENDRLNVVNKVADESDIRWSKADELIDLYSEKDYNNFGWVRVNDVLDPYQWNRVKTNYADAVTNKMHFPKTETGDYMIPVYNKNDTLIGIAFMRGKLSNTIVSKVALINDNLILNEIGSEEEYERCRRIYNHTELDSPISETKRTDFSTYTELRKQRQLQRMASRSYHFAEDEDGAGSSGSNTETEAERKSLKEKDRRYSKNGSEYLEAAESGDEETAGKLVEEAAKEWGAYSIDGKTPLKLYHGTTSFGFTEFDLQKMDDKSSIFLTDSMPTAESYSDSSGERRISSGKKPFTYKSMQELASKYREVRKARFDVDDTVKVVNADKFVKDKTAEFLACIDDVTDGIRLIADEGNKYAQRMVDMIQSDEYQYKYVPRLLTEVIDEVLFEIGSGKYDKNFVNQDFYSNLLRLKTVAHAILNAERIKEINVSDGKGSELIVSGTDENEIISAWQAERTISPQEDDGGNYSLFAKLNNPLIVDCNYSNWNHIEFDMGKGKEFYITRQISDYAAKQGYDGVVFKNIYDYGSFKSDNYDINPADNIVVAFDSSQVKSADPVTYDDEGNVIPLSDRFNAEEKDIRYSKNGSELQDDEIRASERYSKALNIDEMEAESQSILKGNRYTGEKLRRIEYTVKNAKFPIKVNLKAVDKVVSKIIKDHNSKADIKAVSDKVAEAYTLLANKHEMWRADRLIKEATDEILSKVKVEKEGSDEAREKLRQIKSIKFKLDQRQKINVANQYDTYSSWANKYRSALQIGSANSGYADLDSLWADTMVPMARGAFNLAAEQISNISDAEQVSPDDQPLVLGMVIEMLKEQTGIDEDFDAESLRDYVSAEIMTGIYTVAQDSVVDVDKELYDVKRVLKENEESRARLQKELKEIKQRYITDYNKNLSDARQKLKSKGIKFDREAEALAKTRARIEQREANKLDTEERAKIRHRIERRIRRVNAMMTSKRAGSGDIVEYLRPLSESFVQAFNPIVNAIGSKNDFDYAALDRFATEYENLNTADREASGFSIEILTDIKELKKRLAEKNTYRMLTADDLDILDRVASNVVAIAVGEHEAFKDGKAVSIEVQGMKAIAELQKKKPIKKLFKTKGIEGIETAIRVENLTPAYAFKKIGGVLEENFKEIRKGQKKYTDSIQPAKAYFTEQFEKFNVKDWLTEEKEFTTERGESFTLSVDKLMTIYATFKREEMSDQGSSHLMAGGIVLEDQVKGGDYNGHPLTLKDLMQICDLLTKEQKRYADAMVQFMSTDMAARGNEVSMQLYGYEAFKESYYFPFNSARSFLYDKLGSQAEAGGESDQRLKNISFSKATVKGAKTPLLVSDFTKVWLNHVERMSAYCAYVIPMENFTKVWNYKMTDEKGLNVSVNSMLKNTMGADYAKYVSQFISDLNGGAKSDYREEKFGKLVSLFKRNAVLLSASVGIQQPSAIARAFAYINPKYFVASTIRKPMQSYAEAMKYSSAAVLKDIGGYDVGMSGSIQDWIGEAKNATDPKLKRAKDKFDEVAGIFPEKMDAITWGHIWEAVKREQKAKTGLTGEALLQACGERFDEVIDLTQVYDSTFVRSGNMRSKGMGMNMITAFMAEPTVTINMLMDAFTTERHNKAFVAGTLAAVACSLVFNSLLKSIVTAARHQSDDKKYLEKYIQEFFGNLFDDASPFGMIPLVRDIWSIFKGYNVDRSDMSMVKNLVKQINSISNALKDLPESDNVVWDGAKITGNVLATFSQVFGIPLGNINRDVWGVVNTIAGEAKPGKVTKRGIVDSIKSSVPFAKERKKDERLYEAWCAGDADEYEKITGMYNSGDSIKSALGKHIKEDYMAGRITYDQARAMLIKAEYDEGRVDTTIKNWEKSDDSDEGEDKHAGLYTLN